MNKIKDDGVSPVIATVLLIALTIVLISLVSLAVMAGIGSFVPAENKVVGFTVEVNATNNTALVTPVSGNDLPFMESYRVYTNNGHWDSPDAGSITVTDFNSTVTYVNIVGDFPDYVTALVFSGKVVIEGGVIVVEPDDDPSGGGQYYTMGTDGGGGFTSPSELNTSLNDWWHVLHPDSDIAFLRDNQLALYGDITIGQEPLTINQDLEIMFPNNNDGGLSEITFFRAPGYDGPLLVIESGADVNWNHGTRFTLDGNGHGDAPLMVIEDDASFIVATITLINNTNPNGNGGGIYNEGSLRVYSALNLHGNTAMNGAGLYNSGNILQASGLSITGNIAYNKGGGIYNSGTFPYSSGSISSNSAPVGSNYYAVAQSTNTGWSLYTKFSPATQTPTTDQAVDVSIP